MKTILKSIRASRTLDDGKSGNCDRDQAVIHSLLSAKGEQPTVPPPADLRRRIAARLEDTAPIAVDRRSWWDRPAIAALVLIGASGAWAVFTVLEAKHEVQPPPVAPLASHARPLAEPTLVTIIHRPFAEEARDIEKDARDAVDHVLDRLPLRTTPTASRD